MNPPARPFSARRGSVYLLALLVVIVVSGIAMVMARGTAVRLRLHQEAVAQAQSRAAALGLVRAITTDLTASITAGKSPHLTTVTPAGTTIGDCTVLLIGRDPSGKEARFDLIGLAGRIGVNSLAVTDQSPPNSKLLSSAESTALLDVPGITLAMVAAMRDWVDVDDVPDADGGAERTDGTYLGASVPYAPRNAPMIGLEELRLVRDITDDLYFGGDANQNGRLDPGETASSGGAGVSLGLRDLLSLESREPAGGKDTVNINQGSRMNGELSGKLTTLFGAARGAELWRELQTAFPGGPVRNRLELLSAMAPILSDDEADLLWPDLIGPEGRVGLIDPWSCPDVLLAALVGSELAEVLIQARPDTAPTGPGWLIRTLTRSQAQQFGHLFTCCSYQFQADVLAVRNDGAGWARLQVGIDCSSGTALVSSLREAENLGWPLPWCTPDALRRRGVDQDPIALLTTAND